MKTEQQQQKFIQLKAVNVGSFSYIALASTVLLLLTWLSRIWLCETLMDCSLPGSSVHGILWSRLLEWVAIPFSGDLPNPGIEPGSPTLQVDSLLSEPPGKPMITGVGWHAFFQGIFRIQGLNPGLPHGRQVLYPLSHQGSPGRYTDPYVIPWRRATRTHSLSVSSPVLRKTAAAGL